MRIVRSKWFADWVTKLEVQGYRMVMDKKNLSDGNKPKVIALSSSEQKRRMHGAVARRAYEIFANRASESGNALEDWRQAESELIKLLNCGLMHLEENLWVETGTEQFETGSIEIWIAARNITICGKAYSSHVNARHAQNEPRPGAEMIFRVLDLPVEIDPSGATVKVRRSSLEILLKKVRAQPSLEVKAAAA